MKQLFNDFIDIIKSATDRHAPSNKLSRRQRKLKQKPWISNSLLKSIKTKQRLYITHFVKGSLDQNFFYKSYANKLNKIKLVAKKRYYLDELQKYRYNAFKTWNTIKSLLSPSNKTSSVPTKIKVGDDVFTDTSAITEKVCDFFSKSVKTLLLKYLRMIIVRSHNTWRIVYPHLCFFQPTSPPEIMQLIYTLKNNKSCNHDNISAYFLVAAAEVIATPLSSHNVI